MRRNDLFVFATNRVPMSSSFSPVSKCPGRDFLLTSINAVGRSFVTKLHIVALYGTVLPGYIPRNFLRHFLHEELCTNVSHMNNICSALYEYFIFSIIFHNTADCIWTNRAKQAALSENEHASQPLSCY
jgi:hypothetical protein